MKFNFKMTQSMMVPVITIIIMQPMMSTGSNMMEMIQICLSMLTLFILPLTIFASVNIIKNQHGDILIIVLMIILLLSFNQKNLMGFYMLFEMSLIPIFFLVMGWGYQPERITASFTMLIYTFFSSLPLLMIILLMSNEMGSFTVSLWVINSMNYSSSMTMFLLLAFLVKLPMFMVHMWLPKAHVEAPISGSMILAALMLKLGGLGLIYMTELMLCQWSLNFLSSISVMGCFFLGVYIICCPDMKVMIAYSSVVHMSMLSIMFLNNSTTGMMGGLIMMISHGFTSAGLFCLANSLYENSHSRSSILNKGLISVSPIITIIGFLLITMNFGGPLTVNLMSEILMISYLVNINYFYSLMVFTMCFSALIYNLVFYATINQGVNMSNMGVFNISSREVMLMMLQVYPSGMMLLSIQF